MKIQQILKLAVAVLALSLGVEVAQAAGPGGLTCYISLGGPCHNNLKMPINQWFADSDPGGHIDGARCIERATEWYNYCGNPIGLLTSYSALNATSPMKGREVNVIFGYRNIYGAGIYGPLGRVIPIK